MRGTCRSTRSRCAPRAAPSARASWPSSATTACGVRATAPDHGLHGRPDARRSAGRASSACARSPTRPPASPTAGRSATTSPGSTRWSEQLGGRGACRHPDGAVGLLLSSLRVFGRMEVHQRRRPCTRESACAGPPLPRLAGRRRRRGAGLTWRPPSGARTPVGSTDPIRRTELVVDRIACDGYGMCAELLPELIELDDWGYPIVRRRRRPGRPHATTRGGPSRSARSSPSASARARRRRSSAAPPDGTARRRIVRR